MWLPFALLSSLSVGGLSILAKKITQHLPLLHGAWLIKAISLVIPVSFLFYFSFPNLSNTPFTYWFFVFLVWVIYPISTYCNYKAINEGELSHIAPIAASTPIMGFLLSVFFLKEDLSVLGVVAICLVSIGVFMFMRQEHVHFSFSHITSQPALLIFIDSFLVAVGSIIDKSALLLVPDPYFYNTVTKIGGIILIFCISLLIYRANGLKEIVQNTPKRLVLLAGLLQGVALLSYLIAVSNGPVAYAVAIRASSFLFTTLFGLVLLSEKIGWRQVAGMAVIVFGLLCFAFA